MPIINLVAKQPGNRLVPSQGRAKVKSGEGVVFKLPIGGTGGKISFVGPSPFATSEVTYDTEVPVTATAKANAAENVFKYSCRGKINGQDFSTDSGGEMEVVR
jgi:hypothetical protein